MSQPNILLILTDEERYPPPYESDDVAQFRRERLPARQALRSGGLELHRHYVASTACLPSRASIFTGQYPSLHGVASTDGLAKRAHDPAMHWLDPNSVPTMGDWFRAAGYTTQYRGKWHISHADLTVPGTHESLATNDDAGRPIAEAVEAYRRADRLDGFGFSGWIGREPHGAHKSDAGVVKDVVYADQVEQMIGDLKAADGPWLGVASFVNPHDIAFAGIGWEALLGQPPVDDSVPSVAEAPSQGDSFAGRPPCHEAFRAVWPQMTYEQPTDEAYRRLYYHLHQLVDAAIARTLSALEASGMADDTIVVFTSDHGDLLGAHGGLQQKWHNAFDEAVRVPFVVKGPGIAGRPEGLSVPTSHVDLLPTLLGLAGVDLERAAAGVAGEHIEVHDLPGRDLSALLRGETDAFATDDPLYFMTEDVVSAGATQVGVINGQPFEAVAGACRVESTIATLPTGADGAGEIWKLNHYYDRLDDWHADHGIAPNPWLAAPAEPFWELHNLTADPEERTNEADARPEVASELRSILEHQREAKRLLPAVRNRQP